MGNTPPDVFSVTINDSVYGGWIAASMHRRLDRMGTEFTCHVVENWSSTPSPPWQIKPFSSCVLKFGGDTLLTGYVDEYSASFDAGAHTSVITGRSKTEDLIDCAPEIKGGQFKGYTVVQVARAACQPFGINVVVQGDAGQIFQDATVQRCETVYSFLERMCRSSGVMMTDDEQGNLVLTTVGSTKAFDALVQGQNILHASSKLNVKKRFSEYIVRGQRALGTTTNAAFPGFGTGAPALPAAAIAPVETSIVARAFDTGVPRYRPTASMAELQLDQAGMQRRATWERNFAFGRATEADIKVAGWRQSNGAIWRVNQLVSVHCPWLQIDQDLLIVGVAFNLDSHAGQTTTLQVGPVEGYTPDPGQVKLHCRRGRKGKTAEAFDGFGISSGPDGS